jgi:Flp pilus assembly protein TadG
VEFALVLTPLLLLVFGIIQYGLYFYSYQTGTYAIQQGVRKISVGDCLTGSNPTLNTYLYNKLRAGATTASSVTSTVSYSHNGVAVVSPSSPAVGDTVSLSVTYPTINLHFPFVPLPNNGSITRTSTAMVENTSSSGVCG